MKLETNHNETRERGRLESFGPGTEPCTNQQFRLQPYTPLLDSHESMMRGN